MELYYASVVKPSAAGCAARYNARESISNSGNYGPREMLDSE